MTDATPEVVAISRGGDLVGWDPRDLLWPVAAAGTFAVTTATRRCSMVASPISALESVAISETAGLLALVAFVAATRRRGLEENGEDVGTRCYADHLSR